MDFHSTVGRFIAIFNKAAVFTMQYTLLTSVLSLFGVAGVAAFGGYLIGILCSLAILFVGTIVYLYLDGQN